ncbi:hypothetical protein [Sedimenticola selenatireducens]|uniref:SH3b domain-containing protein n=2 Tax=Sedimenticola TaxID=349742 RepID=A0A558CX92_9GAMM|nr:hypothetical protein [Sedimenticola selenatireducens]TVO69705.1 hypothetical protein FHP88_17760 [Sedimenticola selenatireducens]TVT53389.1 MAG: hypothetical protein FHK82_12100 [Sedimenticola thiotaurini]
MPYVKPLIIIILVVFSSLVHADRIVPSERVESRLIVRDAPGGDRISSLEPGQSADYIASVPYWYEIRLQSGATGFVSKAWSRVVPDLTTSETLRLGSWNIKKLGHGNQKNYPLVAGIIEGHFDILAVVEVMQKQGGHPGYNQLLVTLGSGWTGIVTDKPRPDTSSGSAEYYAILYRPSIIQPCQGWSGLRYHQDNSGGPNGVGEDRFSREPAYGCFRTVGSTGRFDFMLAAYHARWAEGDIEDIQMEVKHLNEVFSEMRSANPTEKDLLIAGDFNLVPLDLDDAINIEVPTLGSGSTLNGQGERTGNLYDHLVVFDAAETKELIGSAEVIDVRNVATNPRKFFQTVSDHLPIMAKFRVGTDDD